MSTITDGENTYSYNYDSNGIRVSKTINDITTSFDTLNGKILAQYDKKNKLYFQYNGDTPIGFVLNDTQYLYITNLKGDIVGITDIEGNLICKYTYDEWGKLLAITTAEENNAQQLSVAQINPLRYRGYYYDNESGLYYLQSRYYNPELCRFISADDFDYIETKSRFGINAYIYCLNDPIHYKDPKGTKANNDSPTYLAESIVDIFMSLVIFDDISINMIDIFGSSSTENFFGFLENVFLLIPDLAKLFITLVKSVPNDIWKLLDDAYNDSKSEIKIGEFVGNASIWFTNGFLELAAESTFLGAFATWGIGLFPAELAIVFLGLANDDSLTPSQKMTVLFVDGISIIISNMISFAIAAVDPGKVITIIGTIASAVLPGLTDMITKLIIKKKG